VGSCVSECGRRASRVEMMSTAALSFLGQSRRECAVDCSQVDALDQRLRRSYNHAEDADAREESNELKDICDKLRPRHGRLARDNGG
jgi:hypothetical protein